jgi:hypothetical protein
MAYTSRNLKLDAGSMPIPQYFDSEADDFAPLAEPATEETVATLATQTTLAALLAKVLAAPATEAKQDTGNTSLGTIAGKDFATQTTLAALLAKVIAAPSTEAKQDTGNSSLSTIAGKDFSTQTTSAAILAKLTADPATQTTLAAVLAKIIAAPATEAKQDTINTSVQAVKTAVEAISGSGTAAQASDTILIGTGAAHSAGDVVSTNAGEILEFSTGFTAGSCGIIVDSLVTLDQNAVFADGNGYTLWLFNASPTAQATNEVFNLDSLTGYQGKISISALVDRGDNCEAEDKGHNKMFKLAAADTKLYGKLVAVAGETTVSAKTLTINLFVTTA